MGSYPQSPPKGFFQTKIWHPNVDWATGAICVNTLKRDWQPNFGVRHVLIAIRSLLIVPNYDSALNEEAGKQIMSAFSDYVKKGRIMTDVHAIPYRRMCSGKENLDALKDEAVNSEEKEDILQTKTLNDKEKNNGGKDKSIKSKKAKKGKKKSKSK